MQKVEEKPEKRTIGVFGSAFNPPHKGHLDAIRQLDGHYEKILLVPSFRHAFNKAMAPFNIRCQLAQALIGTETFVSDVQVLPIERRLANNKQAGQPIYTWDLLSAISQQYRTDDIDFILGPDNANPEQWRHFYRAADIADRWRLSVVEERVPVRSSLIRQCVADRQNLPEDWLQIPVAKLIKQYRLYEERDDDIRFN